MGEREASAGGGASGRPDGQGARIRAAHEALRSHVSRLRLPERPQSGAPSAIGHYAEFLSELLDRADPVRGAVRIVDLGCYHGVFVEFLHGLGYVGAIGVDAVHGMLQPARDGGLPVVHADAAVLDRHLDADSVDVAAAINFFHVDWPGRTAEDRARRPAVVGQVAAAVGAVLKPGGIFWCNAEFDIDPALFTAAGFAVTRRDRRTRTVDGEARIDDVWALRKAEAPTG